MPEQPERRDEETRERLLDDETDGETEVDMVGDTRIDHADAGESDAGESATGQSADDRELPAETVAEAERLTRLARRATDPEEAAAYREHRAELLAEHDFAATTREEDRGTVLVCHPAEWLADGAIRPERIDEVDRAVEVPLDGARDPDDWAGVEERNRELVERVREAHGEVHGETASALAAFASDHYAKPVAALTAAELEEFREEYFVRNAWPSDEQREALDESLALVSAALDVELPLDGGRSD